MKTPPSFLPWSGLAVAALLAAQLVGAQAPDTSNPSAYRSEPIPMGQLGSVAGKQYQGDGLSVCAAPEGARLRCDFQRLEGKLTPEGLWLTSTAEDGTGDRFRLVAVAVGRESAERKGSPAGAGECLLPRTGKVVVAEELARFIRPGLTEEYSVSVDGVRQDFTVAERPAGVGDLRVELALGGARAEAAAYGAKFTAEGSGRALAYRRLRVVDATGQELTARLEVRSADRLAVRVADGNAAYPVRIDPTFSDADWVSLNPSMPGANDEVLAIATDRSGNVYLGGNFTVVGAVAANHIAKWNGSTWSALGPGMNDSVSALAVNGTDVYAGGMFTIAGGIPANGIAKWNGSTWSVLGSGVNGSNPHVSALAVSGTDLYAGGYFSTAGGLSANCIAKWNGSTWSALGSGMNSDVHALAVSGTDLYAGGMFAKAGGIPAYYIAKWDGNAWSALGSGMDDQVRVLAVSATDLYVGGFFTTATNAGGVSVAVNYIARWDGNAWSAVGSGMNGPVYALAVSGGDLYAGGLFSVVTNAGGVSVAVNYIAKWDGNAWSALGEGMNDTVHALAVIDTDVYAGGYFTTARNADGVFVTVNRIAKWDGNAWSALGLGINGDVRALVVSGTDLYVGGYFSAAGGGAANYIAKWNGSVWSAVGSGMNGPVYALAVSGGDLYAGGLFSVVTNAGGVSVTVNRIARWDGSTWSALGSGMDYDVLALAVMGTDLYAGGSFSTATNGNGQSVPVYGIAKWNGSTWSALGLGVNIRAGATVNALAVTGTNLYVGGYFSEVDGTVPAKSIAKWNGSAWSALGSGIDYRVYALAVSGTDLYAGGDFTTAGGVPANRIAKWNGSAWSALGSGLYGPVYALAVNGTNLYAGGDFSFSVEGGPANSIAKWNGRSWWALGIGVNGAVRALTVSGTDLYAGGDFTAAFRMPNTSHIAKWNGAMWLGLSSGISDTVSALAVSGTNLYAGGRFLAAGEVPGNCIVKWNGSTWSGVGGGMDDPYSSVVTALAVSETNLYAGGRFTTAGGLSAKNVAKWNGSAWSTLGSGMNGTVWALAVSGTDLYAGGAFSTAGGQPANRIAKWNGTAWSALGEGMNDTVRALAVSGSDLYAGGNFTFAGGRPASYIAKWNGTAWSALGEGIISHVLALAVSGTDLYAGGSFTFAGGQPASYIAKWNGSTWSGLGTGMSGAVYALAVSGSDLYAAGLFTTAGGVAANSIAKWNGSAWSALGSGLDNRVLALAADAAGHLFVGGEFSRAGTQVSPFIALANIGPAVTVGRFGRLAYSSLTGFSCTFSDATLGQPYRIQTSPSLARGSWSDFTNFTYTGPLVISDSSATGRARRFYRALSP